MPRDREDFRDPKILRRFGNLTAASTNEVLLCTRGYTEQDAEDQRSVKSSSNQDKPSGSGAAKVRITYLNSSYQLKTEDIELDGTTRIPTVATDIRFVEKFQVIQGAAAAGAISLLETDSGPQNEFVGIASGTYDAFLCHHYVPDGYSGYVYGWGGSVDDEASFKLMGRSTYGPNMVDEHWDLIKLSGIASPPGLLTFDRKLVALPFSEHAYIRTTVVPSQSSSTVIRGELLIWEDF